MPFVNLKIAGPTLEPGAVAGLQRAVTALMAEALSKRADLTAVLIEPTAPGHWSVAGEALERVAHLEAKVTLGTNTSEEKARFVTEAHALLARALPGPLPLATYVVVHEVAAEAWGYGGLTQAQRARDAGRG